MYLVHVYTSFDENYWVYFCHVRLLVESQSTTLLTVGRGAGDVGPPPRVPSLTGGWRVCFCNGQVRGLRGTGRSALHTAGDKST